MQKIVSMFMAVAVVFGMGLSQSRAAETKPIAALTVASYNDLVSDVNFVGNLVERPQLGAVLDGGVALITQFKGLVGIDKTRPWGAIVQASGETDFSVYAFLPVTDFKQALSLLELYSTVDSEGGVYKLTPKDGKKVSYVKQQGAWAFLADKPETLAHCAADPSALLGNLKKEYIVGGRIFLANVPEGLREKFLSRIQAGHAEDRPARDESSEEFANRKKIVEQVEPYLTRVVSELDQVVFGWGLDRTAEKTFIDVSVTAKSGTKTAEEMGLAAKCHDEPGGIPHPRCRLHRRVCRHHAARQAGHRRQRDRSRAGQGPRGHREEWQARRRACAGQGTAQRRGRPLAEGRQERSRGRRGHRAGRPQGRHGYAGRLRRRRRAAGQAAAQPSPKPYWTPTRPSTSS